MTTVNVPLVVRLLASSVSVANRAGKIVRDVMSKGELGIVEKGKDDYQTEADRSAQRCIVASLAAQYPNVNIIGEEDGSDNEIWLKFGTLVDHDLEYIGYYSSWVDDEVVGNS